MSDNGGFTLTGSAITYAGWLQVAHALALEVNTGMKATRGSVMLRAKQLCGSPKRTKKGVLGDYVKWLAAELPHDWTPSPSIKKALGQ